MTARCRLAFPFVVVLLVASSAGAKERPAGDAPTQVVQRLFAAFNAHSPERMAELVTEDFELYYMTDGKAVLGTQGPDALRKEMAGYFASLPTVRSKAERGTVSGSYLSFRETVSWEHEGKTRTQFSLAVYEVRDGRIRRVWYYPAER